MLSDALVYAQRNWLVFPCQTGGKAPATPKQKPPTDDNPEGKGGLYYGTIDQSQIRQWWALQGRAPNKNIGLRTGSLSGLWVLDVDGEVGERTLIRLQEENGQLPRTLVQRTGRGGRHYFFKWNPDADVRNRGKFAPGLDVRGQGGYVLLAPSIYTADDKVGDGRYEWLCNPTIEIAEAPAWLLEMVRKHARPTAAPQPINYAPPAISNGQATPYGSSVLMAACQEIASAPEGNQNTTLIERSTRVGSFIPSGHIDDQFAFNSLVNAGMAMPSHNPHDPWTRSVIEDIVRRGMDHGKKDPNYPEPIKNKPSISRGPISSQADPRNQAQFQTETIEDPESLIQPGMPLTEDLVARIFTEKYKGRLVYCHSRGKWYEFDASTWREQETPAAFHYARELCRRLTSQPGTGAASVQKVRFSAGVEKFSQADPAIARTIKNFDADPLLLGTPNGTVDLRTGKMRPAMATDYITRSTAVAPHSWADCPMWLDFLDQATGGDEELQYFLQQIAGYALTGMTSEQALFFIYGPGGNGKGVFINTLMKIFGDYAQMASMDTFTAGRHASIPADLAMLAGARLVAASETGEGEKWDQKRIASLTGQDPITARFLRQNFFTFLPQFTLMIVGNHKPALSSVDDAMRRRINIIPFTIKPERPDPDLQHKLEQEWPAILRWAIDGCVEWQKHRLKRPKIVSEATEEYFQDQNTMAQWLIDECNFDITNSHLATLSGPLFAAWANYAKRNGEDPGNAKSFKAAMEKLGAKYKRDMHGRWFQFVQLRTDDHDS